MYRVIRDTFNYGRHLQIDNLWTRQSGCKQCNLLWFVWIRNLPAVPDLRVTTGVTSYIHPFTGGQVIAGVIIIITTDPISLCFVGRGHLHDTQPVSIKLHDKAKIGLHPVRIPHQCDRNSGQVVRDLDCLPVHLEVKSVVIYMYNLSYAAVLSHEV